MKILFLTSSPGYGHTRAAEAIAAAVRSANPELEASYLDITQLINEQLSIAVQDGYLRMTTEQPALYQKLYDMDKGLYRQLAGKIPADQTLIDFLTQQQRLWCAAVSGDSLLPGPYHNLDSALFNTLINGICNRTKMPAGRLLLQGLLGLIYTILATRLKNYVNDCAPDLLVATQMYPNALLSRSVKKGAVAQPIIGVVTDYGIHGIWVRDTTDLYCVSHQAAADKLQQQGVAGARIQITGIPLMPEFENPPTQRQARLNLGLDERPSILITGGQCGIGIVDTLQPLLRNSGHPYRILLAAGHSCNHRLKQLAQQYSERLQLFGWSNHMVDLICAADLVVGKPGGLTLSESLACGRPFIATCCLGGQESHNLEFLVSQGAGCHVELAELPAVLQQLFANPERLLAMKQRAGQSGSRHGARAIAARIESIARATRYSAMPRQCELKG